MYKENSILDLNKSLTNYITVDEIRVQVIKKWIIDCYPQGKMLERLTGMLWTET